MLKNQIQNKILNNRLEVKLHLEDLLLLQNMISNIGKIIPSHVIPLSVVDVIPLSVVVYPSLQEQVKDPSVFSQFCVQLSVSALHSSTSEG